MYVEVLKSGTTLSDVNVDIQAGPVLYPDVKKSVTLSDGTMKWDCSMKAPGFYSLKVTAHVDGKDYEGNCAVGFSPEKIIPATQCPADFDAFWEKALKEAR